MRWTLLLFLVACGGREPTDLDAAVPDAEPPVPLEFGGKVSAVVDFQVTAVEGAPVELRRAGDDTLIAGDTTDAEGAFAFSVIEPAPLDAYLDIDDGTHLPTRIYPQPLAGGEDLLTVVADATEIGVWYAQVGDTFDATDRTAILVVVDAAGDSLGGTTIAVDPAPATLTYYDPDVPAWDPSLTTSVNGFALATGTAASITLDVDTYPSRTVELAAGELTMVVLAP